MRKMIAAFLLLGVQLMAQPLITMSGDVIGGVSSFKQNSDGVFQNQFESVGNVNVNLEVSQTVTTGIGFTVGIPNSKTGFLLGSPSSSVAVNNLFINYAPKNVFNTVFSVGYLTVPFGQYANEQTNYAALNSHFIVNDLMYVFLSQGASVSGLATGAIQSSTPLPGKFGTFDTAIFNGTTRDADNNDNSMGILARYTNDRLIQNVKVGVSALTVDDYINDNVTPTNNRFNGNLTAAIGDIKITFDDLEIGGYISVFNVNDSNASTQDYFNFLMAHIIKPLTPRLSLAGRYSFLRSQDYNGTGEGITAGIHPSFIGFGTIPVADVDLSRAQVSLIANIETNFRWFNEIVFDMYGEERSDYNQLAILSYASITF
jgi:hypothetical protein